VAARAIFAAISGIAIWALPYVVGTVLTLFGTPPTSFAGTINNLSICCAATLFSVLLLPRFAAPSAMTGAVMGVAWLAICVLIDLPIHTPSMGFAAYVRDIALAYLMLPVIAAGVGAAYARKAVQDVETIELTPLDADRD